MRRVLLAPVLAAAIGCDAAPTETVAPVRAPDNTVALAATPTELDGWLDALAGAFDSAAIVDLAERYLASVDAETAAIWALETDDDRMTHAGMRGVLADALHADRRFARAIAEYEALLAAEAPIVSRGRLHYRLAFARAGATLDDAILDDPALLVRLYAELRALDGVVAADDEARDQLDYMLVVLGHLAGTPDHPRALALADAVSDEIDASTLHSRATLLDLARDAALATGDATRAARLTERRDRLAALHATE